MANDIETWYQTPDPWGYTTNPEDAKRKKKILAALKAYAPFTNALDIGCGEGFITADLPAKTIYGIEESDTAASRLPKKVKRIFQPKGKYDLIVCTGVLYDQYDATSIIRLVEEHAKRIVLTCNIADWERNMLPQDKIVYEERFPYREFEQHLVVYKW